jgi:hypothetical protein
MGHTKSNFLKNSLILGTLAFVFSLFIFPVSSIYAFQDPVTAIPSKPSEFSDDYLLFYGDSGNGSTGSWYAFDFDGASHICFINAESAVPDTLSLPYSPYVPIVSCPVVPSPLVWNGSEWSASVSASEGQYSTFSGDDFWNGTYSTLPFLFVDTQWPNAPFTVTIGTFSDTLDHNEIFYTPETGPVSLTFDDYDTEILDEPTLTSGISNLTDDIPIGVLAGLGVGALLFSLKFIIPLFKGTIK